GVGRAGGGKAGEARDFLRRAMELEPRVGIWPLLSARALMADEGLPFKQRLEEARRDLTHLVEKVDKTLPLPQAALGWIRYLQGDADEAIDRWNSAEQILRVWKVHSPREAAYQAALLDWLRDSKVKVTKWKSTRIWRDDFSRPDGPALSNGWTEDEKNVKISLEGGNAVFGPGKLQAEEKPRFWREEDVSKVLKASFEVEVLPNASGDYQFSFDIVQGKNLATRIGLLRTDTGEARLLVKVDHRTKEAEIMREIPGFTWPENGKVSFGFVKMDEAKGTVAVTLNGAPIPGYEALELQNLMKSRGGRIRFEASCSGLAGTEVRATVEAVEIWRDTQ
ncbi:MAG: hypothetical protein HUU06_02380, partial [Planctomycetaceae bacterium]|nr:hypothetical protein [Planctomycetaceae bacterium]